MEKQGKTFIRNCKQWKDGSSSFLSKFQRGYTATVAIYLCRLTFYICLILCFVISNFNIRNWWTRKGYPTHPAYVINTHAHARVRTHRWGNILKCKHFDPRCWLCKYAIKAYKYFSLRMSLYLFSSLGFRAVLYLVS